MYKRKRDETMEIDDSYKRSKIEDWSSGFQMRGAYETVNLYGSNPQETARNMLIELTNFVFEDIDNPSEPWRGTFTIDEPSYIDIANFRHLSQMSRLIISYYNQLPGKKRLTINATSGTIDVIVVYSDEISANGYCYDDSFDKLDIQIIEEVLLVMAHFEPYNSNCWKLDGSHRYLEEYKIPRYIKPY